jgi:hypothetical protein
MIHSNEDIEPTVEELPGEEEQAEEIAERKDEGEENEVSTAAPEGQTSLFSNSEDNGPRLDATALFQQDLSQEELSDITEKELEQLHDKAREVAENNNPDRSESILVIETYRTMRKRWEEQ